MLSAEPLVGLKQIRRDDGETLRTFSRTPRGFEATGRQRVTTHSRPFSRTPRGFEARTSQPQDRVRTPFSRTPRGFEAHQIRDMSNLVADFQPNPSWV